jgi:activator of 2-hydroxyglutaryl-CoA dehydratase
MVVALQDKLGVPVDVPDGPQFAAALGAALLGRQRFLKTGRPVAA